MSPRLLLFGLFALKSVCPLLIQSPEVVKVPFGGSAVLQCDLMDFLTLCDEIKWFKMHPRTKQLHSADVVHKETVKSGQCQGLIHNASADDSGTYFCSVIQSVISYMGSGSKVIITDPNPQPTVTLLVPGESDGPDVPLQCLVMGVIPSEVNVSWVVKWTVLPGWTESGWTSDDDSALEFTRAHVTVPSSLLDDVECLVQLEGETISKSLNTGVNGVCTWLVYMGFGAAFFIILPAVVVLVFSCRVKRGTHTEGGSCVTEVHYASVDLAWTGQRSSGTTLKLDSLK